MNDPYQKDDGGGFGQWQNPQSPQVFNQMLGRGGGTPYQQPGPQGLKQGRPNRNLFAPPSNGGINPGGLYGSRPEGGPPPMGKPYDPGRMGGNPFGNQGNGGINPGGMFGGGAMPPPTDLPPPRFPVPGNTGPMPPAPGMQRPMEPPFPSPPPPPNPDPWFPGEGGPPPIEDPHGQFPMQPQGPWGSSHAMARTPWGGGQRPQRPSGGDQGYGAEPFRWRT